MTESRFSAPAARRPPLKGPVLFGLTAIALFFGGFGAWAVVTPLSSAAGAPGQVRVESYRKTVQHLEGGIIREILVKDGDLVEKGQVLVRLDNIQATASTDAIRSRYNALRALEARLIAERDGAAAIAFPTDLRDLSADARVGSDLEGQERMFANRKVSLAGQIELLTQRASQLQAETEAYKAQQVAAEDQIKIAEEELATVEDLLERGIERRPRLLGLQREIARLEGERGEQMGMTARAEQAIGETKLQITDLQNTRMNDISAELRETQTALSELQDRLRAANDISLRTEIVAPEAGRVMQLRHVTSGGVLRPGDPILDLVPGDDRFVIEARISPLDIDTVHAGLDAEVKLTSVKQRRLPILIGEVKSVSADAITDERSGSSYYLAEIVLPDHELGKLEDIQLYPGMPLEVLVVTGDRTPYDYFVDPIRDSFHRAFREE